SKATNSFVGKGDGAPEAPPSLRAVLGGWSPPRSRVPRSPRRTDDNAPMGHSHGDKESTRVHAGARLLLFVLVVPLLTATVLGLVVLWPADANPPTPDFMGGPAKKSGVGGDRKSTRLNSSHSQISYAVF